MNKISITFLALLMFPVFGSNAQTGIGTNTPQAALDVSSSDSGILIPRLFLTGYNTFINAGTASTSDNSMLVYNTNTATNTGLGGSGYYYWDGGALGKWYRMNENIAPWKSNSNGGQYAINDLASNNGIIYANLTGTNTNITPDVDVANWRNLDTPFASVTNELLFDDGSPTGYLYVSLVINNAWQVTRFKKDDPNDEGVATIGNNSGVTAQPTTLALCIGLTYAP